MPRHGLVELHFLGDSTPEGRPTSCEVDGSLQCFAMALFFLHGADGKAGLTARQDLEHVVDKLPVGKFLLTGKESLPKLHVISSGKLHPLAGQGYPPQLASRGDFSPIAGAPLLD